MRSFLLVLMSLSFFTYLAQGAPRSLQFRESMSGLAKRTQNDVQTILSLKTQLTVTIPDIKVWAADTQHQAQVNGVLEINQEQVPVSGTLDILAPAPQCRNLQLHYILTGKDPRGWTYHLDGAKILRHEKPWRLLDDHSKVFGKFVIEYGPSDTRTFDMALKFHWINPVNMARFIGSFHSGPRAKIIFARVWSSSLAREYLQLLCR